MISKILKIIDSCKTAEQIGTCSDWLNIVELSYDDRMSAIGAMHLKLKQIGHYLLTLMLSLILAGIQMIQVLHIYITLPLSGH
jgi:hypothetical protein